MGTPALRAVLLLAHLAVAAARLGGMAYSLALVGDAFMRSHESGPPTVCFV